MPSDSISIPSLIELLQLKRLDEQSFLGQNWDIGNRAVFGGQIIGQGLSAAQQTVDESRQAHSLHAYFLRPGDLKAPIRYEVERTRDGHSFSTRRVQAIQHDRPVLQLAVSFQIAEDGVTHQVEMPVFPPPDQVAPIQLAQALPSGAPPLPKRIQRVFGPDSPFEFRFLDPSDPIASHFQATKGQARVCCWMRLRHPAEATPTTHRSLLAYASDFNLLQAAARPHGLHAMRQGLHLASLDHALWFHRPFRVDEWLLCDYESPTASNARGFTRGQIFNQDGALIASSVQEGLMRTHATPPGHAG